MCKKFSLGEIATLIGEMNDSGNVFSKVFVIFAAVVASNLHKLIRIEKQKQKIFSSVSILFVKKKRKIETFLEYCGIQNKFEMKTQIFFPLKLSTRNGIIQQIRKKSHNVLWNAHLEQDDFD